MPRIFHTALALIVALALLHTPHANAQALGDQWFLGIGGGVSSIEPEAESDDDSTGLSDDQGRTWNLLIGRDFDHLSSGQLQFFSLGEAAFENEDTVDYQGVEAALLYRFFDSRDERRIRSPFSPSRSSYLGFSLYGRFGVGYLERDSRPELRDDNPAYFGVGAGVEGYVTRNLGIRLEARYLDTDATASSVSLIGRFGGYKSRLLSSVKLPTRDSVQPVERAAERAAPVNSRAESVPAATIEQQAERAAQVNTRTEAVPAATIDQPETIVTELQPAQGQTDITRSDRAPLVTVTPDALPTDTEVREPSLLAPASDGSLLSTTPIAEQTIPAPSDQTADGQPARFNQPEDQGESLSTLQPGQSDEDMMASAGLSFADSDSDGVMDADDRCPASTRGFPVNVAGCGVFFGELEGIEFSDDGRKIVSDSTQTLDAYARLLQRYPQSRIEIVAHTDDSGTKAEQSLRTRTRLRTLGLYLVDKGATSDQLILRSFGGNRPRSDNNTEAGRRANNRIEIFERPRL